MVRVASALLLSICVADEDVYHHTQLLQTKVSPQKVAIDADGAGDQAALFQSSLHTKLFRRGKALARNKITAVLDGLKARQDPNSSSYGGSSSYDWSSWTWDSEWPTEWGWNCPEDEWLQGEAKMYYGDDVDSTQYCNCMMTMPWQEVPWDDFNDAVRFMSDWYDECMGGIDNSVTQACEAEYGADVGLADCHECGWICECSSPEDCDLDCHRECMANDGDRWAMESSYDSSWWSSYSSWSSGSSSYGGHEDEMCKLFYGDDVDVERCESCGMDCYNTTEYPQGLEHNTMHDAEKAFYEALGQCIDECVGMSPNLVTQTCQKHYGDDVDIFGCITCGVYCGCKDTDEACEYSSESYACHPTCMEDEWYAPMSSYSYVKLKNTKAKDTKAKALATFAEHMKEQTKLVRSTKLPKKVENDATDLMQTSQHLKK